MKRIDGGVVLGVAGAFVLLVLLVVLHPLSCIGGKK